VVKLNEKQEISKMNLSNPNITLSEDEKSKMVKQVSEKYSEVLDALKIDWKNDPNSKETPNRVAKALVYELFSGRFEPKPSITRFPNDGYTWIIFQGNIDVTSCCSHHHNPFVGKAYVAYIPKKEGKVIGLSKINRIVEWYSRRPQIQEGLTKQIADELSELLETEGLVVLIKAKHMCCSSRGVKHDSEMITCTPTGFFLTNKDGCKDEFFKMIDQLQ